MSGLRANQAALVDRLVATSPTRRRPAMSAQNVNQIELASGGAGAGVQVTGVNRQLDQYIQTQLRTETSGGAYADQIANILGQLQNVYGTPGEARHAGNRAQQFHHRAAGAVGELGRPVAQIAALDRGADRWRSSSTRRRRASRRCAPMSSRISASSVGQANAAMTQIAQHQHAAAGHERRPIRRRRR